MAPPVASGYAIVVGKAPAPSSVIILKPQQEQAIPVRSAPPPSMDQRGQMFLPDMLMVRAGQSVTFLNSDSDLHNINVKESRTREQAFNVAIPTGGSHAYTFEREGFYDVACDIHPGMAALIVATSSPYATVADREGNFTLNDVPFGSYVLTFQAGRGMVEKPITVSSARTAVDLTTSEGS